MDELEISGKAVAAEEEGEDEDTADTNRDDAGALMEIEDDGTLDIGNDPLPKVLEVFETKEEVVVIPIVMLVPNEIVELMDELIGTVLELSDVDHTE